MTSSGIRLPLSADKVDPSFFVSVNPARHQEQLFSGLSMMRSLCSPTGSRPPWVPNSSGTTIRGLRFSPAAGWHGRQPKNKPVRGRSHGPCALLRASTSMAGPICRSFRLSRPIPCPPSRFLVRKPGPQTETLIAYELGYRIEITKNVHWTPRRFTMTYHDDSARPRCADTRGARFISTPHCDSHLRPKCRRRPNVRGGIVRALECDRYLAPDGKLFLVADAHQHG